jgi:SAM-dependent methyltransferase
VRLPPRRYDVIWTSGCLHHIANLEHLFDEVQRALLPGGLFVVRDYVGERRRQFAPSRLARVNAALRTVPARYRHSETIAAGRVEGLSPFCAVRSDEIVSLAEARFETVHKAPAAALFPLTFHIDLAAIEREAPELLAGLQAAEEEALRDPEVRPCTIYAVFRNRP